MVMGDRRRLALRAKLIEGYPLARKEYQHLLGCIRPDPVREFALSLADVLNAQLPRHVNARPISDRNFEHDLAFGVTFLDIFVR